MGRSDRPGEALRTTRLTEDGSTPVQTLSADQASASAAGNAPKERIASVTHRTEWMILPLSAAPRQHPLGCPEAPAMLEVEAPTC
jgi:hypothetical protein